MQELSAGAVVEFFEEKEVLCAVVLVVKGQRYAVLTEENREMNVAAGRLLHAGERRLDVKAGRDALVKRVRETAALRSSLKARVDAAEIWALADGEAAGFTARDVAGLVFSEAVTDDHVAAVQRALLDDRIYFQFRDGRFLPRPAEKVEQRQAEIEREARREAELSEGSAWIAALWAKKTAYQVPETPERYTAALKDFAVFGDDSQEAAFVRELMKRGQVPPHPRSAFTLLVRLGIFTEDENLHLHEAGIALEFPEKARTLADERAGGADALLASALPAREDLRGLPVFTVDSASTRDYDDALSVVELPDGTLEAGVHIADAAEFVTPGDALDREAFSRATSIYLPDRRIPMLPAILSEGALSLRAGEDRLALSFLLRMDREGEVLSFRMAQSVVRVARQLTYHEVDRTIGSDPGLSALHALAAKLRERRLAAGAVILPLPEVDVHVDAGGVISLSRHEKETPSQVLVSEMMIAANGAAAAWLSERSIPALFRTQAECRPENNPVESDHPLFQAWRARRLFARAGIETKPKAHCSLGMACYTSVTSPIRRYVDLVVERQIKHALETGAALLSEEDLSRLTTQIETTQQTVGLIQRKWTRYWLLKYIEQEKTEEMDALVLEAGGRFAHVLFPDLLLEANLPVADGTPAPKPGAMTRLRVERVSAREDMLKLAPA